jgi:hypothetical protein
LEKIECSKYSISSLDDLQLGFDSLEQNSKLREVHIDEVFSNPFTPISDISSLLKSEGQ